MRWRRRIAAMRWRWRIAALALALAGVGVAIWAFASGGSSTRHAATRAAPSARAPAAGAPATTGTRRGHHARSHRRPRSARARAPSSGLEVAIQDDAVFTHRYYYDRDLAFRQARAVGASWLRVTVLWSKVAGASAGRARAPAPIPWRFGDYDNVVDTARAHGLRVELSLTGPAPAWASGDHRIGPYRPSAAAYGAFALAAAKHFRGRVTRYSIWNEPNYVSWLRPLSQAPALYRALYTDGYAAIKSVDPGVQVLIGETAAYGQPGLAIPPLAFLRAAACAGCGRLVADGYAHHPYNFTEAPDSAYPGADNVTIGTLGRLTAALDGLARAGRLSDPRGRPLDVYLTEFGYFASGRRALAPALRASYLTRAFAIALGDYPRVRQMLQYLLVAPPRGFPGGRFNTSLISQGGVPSPAYGSLAAWARRQQRRGRLVAAGG